MEKRHRDLHSGDAVPESADCNAVFVDTSLNTYLAMLVFYTDTVAEFKKKLVLAHMECFPEIGEIKIQSLKVKSRGKFYHLSDLLLVSSLFRWVKGDWFLTAELQGKEMKTILKSAVPENIVLTDDLGNNKKKRKRPEKANKSHFEIEAGKGESVEETRGNKGRKKTQKAAVKIQNTSDVEEHDVGKGELFAATCAPAAAEEKSIKNSQNLIASDTRKEDTVLENEILKDGQNVPTEHSEGETVNDSNLSARAKPDGNRKRKKSEKKDEKYIENGTGKAGIGKAESILHSSSEKSPLKLSDTCAENEKVPNLLSQTAPATLEDVGTKMVNDFGAPGNNNGLKVPDLDNAKMTMKTPQVARKLLFEKEKDNGGKGSGDVNEAWSTSDSSSWSERASVSRQKSNGCVDGKGRSTAGKNMSIMLESSQQLALQNGEPEEDGFVPDSLDT